MEQKIEIEKGFGFYIETTDKIPIEKLLLIARVYEKTIGLAVKKSGEAQLPFRGFIKEKKDEIIAMRKEGKTAKQIQAVFAKANIPVSVTTIYKLCRGV